MERDLTPPGLVRVPGGLSLDSDENSLSESDEDSVGSTTPTRKRPRGGVSFSETVAVLPIPRSCTLSALRIQDTVRDGGGAFP